MKTFFTVLLCTVYSAQAWVQDLGSIHVDTKTGQVPPKYYPLTADDSQATRKAGSFVSFIKVLPQLNPFRVPNLGPYNFVLNGLNFQGDVQIQNLVVNGLNQVTVPQLELRLAPTRVDFNASIPQAVIDHDFNLRAVLNNQPINVQGHINSQVNGLAISAAVGPVIRTVNSNQVYQVESGDVSIDIRGLQVNVNMNQHSEEFRTILVDFVSNLNQYSSVVDEILKEVLKAISAELSRVTAKEILQYLLGSSAPSLSG